MKKTYYKLLFYTTLLFLMITIICLFKNKSQKLNICAKPMTCPKTTCKKSICTNNNTNLNKVAMKLSNKQENDKKSYGMFANKNIKKGELIEHCPILVEDPNTLLKSGILKDYYFELDGNGIFPLGYGGMYNHSNDPNAEVSQDNIDIKNRTLKVMSKKNIMPGDEVTISYGNDYWESRNIIPN